MANILEEIVEYKKTIISRDKALVSYDDLEKQALEISLDKTSFKDAITNDSDYKKIRIISEVKKASPSKGVIEPNFDPYKTAELYFKNGANAVSVLTDEKYFQGENEYLINISRQIPLPCLRKDFIIEEYQILQAKLFGASAYLLIVDCLNSETLKRLIRFGKELGLDALVETHRQSEVETAMECGAEIIGVNNRNLRTFETSLQTSIDLRPLVPKEIPFISESGISKREDIELLLEHEVSAILVGESFMRQGAGLFDSIREYIF